MFYRNVCSLLNLGYTWRTILNSQRQIGTNTWDGQAYSSWTVGSRRPALYGWFCFCCCCGWSMT